MSTRKLDIIAASLPRPDELCRACRRPYRKHTTVTFLEMRRAGSERGLRCNNSTAGFERGPFYVRADAVEVV